MSIGDGINLSVARSRAVARLLIVVGLMMLLALGIGGAITRAQSTTASDKVSNISTGHDTACAVVEYWVQCWGSNSQGQLGIGQTGDKLKDIPVKVANNKNALPADPGVCASKNWFGQCTKYSRQPAPAKPASEMAGLGVEKVSVGKTHTCALADARVFCWGDNSRGQLGNRSTKDSPVPVAVDTQPNDIAAVYANPSPCGGWFQPACKPVLKEAAKAKSGLKQKEIMDILTGEYFSCALATDGTVSCWGEGDFGRLGTGNTKDVNYPVQIANSGTSALRGKKGVKLAKVSESTACVLAVPQDSESEDSRGYPYCWGYGVGDGSIPNGQGSTTVKCSKTSPRSMPSGTSKDVYFHALSPVAISESKSMSMVASNGYVTGLGSDKKAYYWGMHGHRETVEYQNVSTCKIDPCRSATDSIKLAGYSSTSRTTTQKNKNGTSRNTNHYSGRATPNTKAGQTTFNRGDGCNKADQTHYGYTKVHKFTEIGKITPASPTTTSLTSNLSLFSGDVVDGMFCGVTNAGAYCDAHGSGVDEGQTGSGYVKQCTTTTILFIFSSTTCQPAPSGPQKVTTSGWLGTRKIESLSTGTSGFTCALANNSVACWGLNSKGQLGVGDTSHRNTPTQVNGL